MSNKLMQEYKLTGNEQASILNFLSGKITSREAGKAINLSHQQIINLTTSLVRSWVKQGKLNLNADRLFPNSPSVPKKYEKV